MQARTPNQDRAPVDIVVGNFYGKDDPGGFACVVLELTGALKGVKGMIVGLDDQARLSLMYLGTSPPVHAVSPQEQQVSTSLIRDLIQAPLLTPCSCAAA